MSNFYSKQDTRVKIIREKNVFLALLVTCLSMYIYLYNIYTNVYGSQLSVQIYITYIDTTNN